MASSNLNKQMMCLITVISKRNLLDNDRDIIADFVSEEARKATECYNFILHDIVESKRYCKILIEGKKTAITNLLLVIKDNLPYNITYRRYNK
jgi:hypothetical protein